MGVNSHEWPRQNFSLQYQYNIKRKRAKNKEKYQLGVIQYQILQTNVIGIIWQMVRRITKEIIRVKELKLIPLLDVTYFSFNFVALKWLPFSVWNRAHHSAHYVCIAINKTLTYLFTKNTKNYQMNMMWIRYQAASDASKASSFLLQLQIHLYVILG